MSYLPPSFNRASRLFRRGLLLLVPALLFPIAASAAADGIRPFPEERAVWEDHFRQMTDLTVKGSGWKPFNRWVWFYEPRIDESGYVPAGARWDGFLQMRSLADENNEILRDQPIWTCLGPVNIAGRCQPIAIDPSNHDRMLVGSASGGLWESTNAGASWEPVDDRLPSLAVGAVIFDPNDPSIVYMGTGEGNNSADAVFGVGVLRSTDGGSSWEIFGSGLDWGIGDGRAVNRLSMNPSNGSILVATTAGTYRNQGGAWIQTLAGVGVGIARHPFDPQRVYVTVGSPWGSGVNGVYVSTDDGLTWTELTNGFPSVHGRCDIAICDSQPEILYCGVSDTGGAMLGIYKTTDGGSSWSLVNNGNHYSSQGWYDLVIAVDPIDPARVYSGGVDIWGSTDGGATFARRTRWDYPPGHPQYVHADQHGWAFHPEDPGHVYAACDGGVFQSFDAGFNWEEISTGLTTMQFYDIEVAQSDPSIAMGGTQDNGTNVFGGSTSWARSLGGDGFHCNIDYARPDTMFMEYQFGNHYRSYTGGGNLVRIMSGIGEDGPWDTPVHLDYENTAVLYTAHRKIYKTTNRGSLWTAKTVALPGSGVTIAQAPSDPSVLYAGFSAPRNIHRSTDRGETWTQLSVTGIPSRQITRLRVHPLDPNTVYATYSGFSTNNVWKSVNGGVDWTSIGGNLPAIPVNAIAIDPDDPNVIYVGTDLGVWRTEDGGALWLPYGNGLPNTVVGDLRINENERILRCGTYGRGLWEIPLTEAGAGTVQENAIPAARLQILQLFPNPIAAGARSGVRFALAEAGRVRVQLFDASGRLIEQPFDGDLEAGTHRIDWPSRAPSGVYFVKVRQGHEVSAAKLTIRR